MSHKSNRDAEARFRQAKAEAKAVMLACAACGEIITYGELVAQIVAIRLIPNSSLLARILTEISMVDLDPRQGILAAVVVRKDIGIPGSGFFKIIDFVGRSTAARRHRWTRELERAHQRWSAT